jgi:erythromycin esterase-like protein
MASLHAIAHPIFGEDELDEVAERFAHKRLVLLGEATHGTHEFYDLRAALTRRLIRRHGFAAVVVEGDWPDALRVDRYVRGLPGDDEDAEAALGAFERFPRWMWRNEDALAFIEWLRIHNRGLAVDRRIGFYGLDLYSLHSSIHAVLQYLDDNDPPAAARARERYACFDHVAADPERYGLQAHLGIGPRCETEVVAQLVEMQRRKIARSGRTPAGDAWFHAVQQAHVVRNAEAYYRTMFAGRSASWNLRDTHMADTLDLVAQHLGEDGVPAKLIVWAHNSHVGDARATEMGDSGQLTLGQLARQRHDAEVALVGFTTYDGSVIAAHDWDEPPLRRQVRPALDDSWEALLHEADHQRFYITAGALREAIDGAERLQRAIGVVYRPDTERRSHYLSARLAEQFDLVIHVDTTRAVVPLDAIEEQMPSAGEPELPETFPTGV